MKQSAWYSIIKLLDSIDPVWHARLYMAENVTYMQTITPGKQIKSVLQKWQLQSLSS